MADPTDSKAQSQNLTAQPGQGIAPSNGVTPGESHQPYVPDNTTMSEFTWQAVIVGAALGIVFGASSLYLVLRVGLTVSASIPVAVISITLFRLLRFRTTILENNIVQTTGSAGESIAFGVGVTMPALLLIGFEMTLTRIMVVSLLGGLLGILMMIPLRRAFIVKLHGRPGEEGKLLYPEGTACAQVLISGEKGGTSGATVFAGFGVAFFHKFITEGMNVFRSTVKVPLNFFSKAAAVSCEMASELLGVGYIIGLRTSAVMMAGAVLGFLVLVPAIFLGGESAGLKPEDVYKNYLRFIGAGCVAAAGIISMGRTLPMIVRSFSSGLSIMRGGAQQQPRSTRRTEDDLPPQVVLGGTMLLLALLTAFLLPEVHWRIVAAIMGAVLVLVFGFLFVTVSSRLTGEIGSSSNPISGMTVATLLLTCLIFLTLGMTTPQDAVLALSIGGVVCIAASNGGTTSQDLKTGFLLGGTPKWQQIAIIVGAVTSALVIGITLQVFARAGIVYSQRDLPVYEGKMSDLAETDEYLGETFHVWRPENNKKYLVDDKGQVCYRIDPTITGTVKKRDRFEEPTSSLRGTVLSKAELARIPTKDDKGNPINTVNLREDGKLKVYTLWTNKEPSEEQEEAAKKDPKKKPVYRSDVEDGEYLVNASGRIVHTVEGDEVKMKFEAPKTQVMGIIINGLLGGNLKWTLVLIGAFIAVSLELCGISSLAFAVGVYVPMQYSTPIFLGGILRWAVDTYYSRQAHAAIKEGEDSPEARARAEVEAIAKSETSPGVLLSSGLIAGGSLGGVLIAFLNLPFFEKILKAINMGHEVKGETEPMVDTAIRGVDVAPLPLFLLLMALVLAVGIGKLMPHKEEKS